MTKPQSDPSTAAAAAARQSLRRMVRRTTAPSVPAVVRGNRSLWVPGAEPSDDPIDEECDGETHARTNPEHDGACW